MNLFSQSGMVYFKAGRTDPVRKINFDLFIGKSFNGAPNILIISNHLAMHADWNDIPSHTNLADILQHQQKSALLHPMPGEIKQFRYTYSLQ
jgi:hypothetical protein